MSTVYVSRVFLLVCFALVSVGLCTRNIVMLGTCVDFRADIKSARELLATASVTKSENQEAVCDALESMEQVTIYQYIHMHICM